MHRWTPVSSTVPWSTSTSQEVFHVDTNLPRKEFLICTFVNRAPKPFFGNPNEGSSWLSCLSIPHFVALLVRDSSPWAGSSSVPLFQQMPTERVKW